MQKNLLIIAILVILVGAGGFFAGIKYQQNQRPNNYASIRQGFMNNSEQGQNRTRIGGQVIGEILNKDDSSITVKMPDSSSKIVLLSNNTSISKTAKGSEEDLTVGQQVMVLGTSNTDGSVTARNIQLNPQFGGLTRTGTASGSPR